MPVFVASRAPRSLSLATSWPPVVLMPRLCNCSRADRLLAIGAHEKPLALEVGKATALRPASRCSLPTNRPEAFLEQRPGIEPVPGRTERAGQRQLRLALLQALGDLSAPAAAEFQLESLKAAHQLGEMRHDQRNVHRARQCQGSGAISPLFRDVASDLALSALS